MIDFLVSLPLWALAVVLNVWLMGFALAFADGAGS